MRLIKPIKAECLNCKKQFEIGFDFECVSTDERQMGTEYDYEGEYEGVCPCCKKEVFVRVEAFEYPKGCVNYFGARPDGIRLLEEPDLEAETDE